MSRAVKLWIAAFAIFTMVVVSSIVIVGESYRGVRVTNKVVGVSDFIGAWTYNSTSPRATIWIVFRPDGTFHQVVNTFAGSRKTLMQDGTWRLSQNMLALDGVLCVDVDGAWKPTDTPWLFGDSSRSPHTIAPLGGAIPDPDFYAELVKISGGLPTTGIPPDVSSGGGS